jgi:membrane-associated phospholipid phosphatase
VTRYPILLVASVAGLLAVALDVTHHGLLERQDARIGRWTFAHTPAAVVRAADVVTQLGSWWALLGLTVLGAIVLSRRGRRDEAILLAGALALVSLATNGLKLAFGRPRPSAGSLKPLHHTLSFPSGHTSGSTVVLVLLALLLATRHRRAMVAGAVLLAGLIGVTRVVVQAHWATDVLAGYCLGAAALTTALLVRARLSPAGRRVTSRTWPEGQNDAGQSRHEKRDGAGRPLAEHRAHDLLPVDDLREPRGR